MVPPIRTTLILPAFWDAPTCLWLTAAIDRGRTSPAEIEVSGYTVDRRVRQTMEVEVDAASLEVADAALLRVRPAVARHFGLALNGAEGAAFFRYGEGGFYLPHRDSLAEADDFKRRITVVIFLGTAARDGTNEAADCRGGTLRLHPDYEPPEGDSAVDIRPQRGTLVAFPADRTHEVLPVISGIRDVVVDRFY